MFSVKVKDHIMIAHSLPDPFFGPAANLHGATYVVEAIFKRKQLDEHQVVIDIGKATELLQEALKPLAYQNLDEVEFFKGKLTTTEFLAFYIHQEIKKHLSEKYQLKIVLNESHVAAATYED
jgi:6-pyruvoyl-tetrahydropterin synthase